MQFMIYFMALFVRLMVWAFTRGWPVGLGFMVGGLINEFLGVQTPGLIAFVICVFVGYAFMYRDYLFPTKK